jgi:hypothetical protein
MFELNDFVPRFNLCPQCDERGLDNLKTHSYCVNCNYSNVTHEPPEISIPEWALKALPSRLTTFSNAS